MPPLPLPIPACGVEESGWCEVGDVIGRGGGGARPVTGEVMLAAAAAEGLGARAHRDLGIASCEGRGRGKKWQEIERDGGGFLFGVLGAGSAASCRI